MRVKPIGLKPYYNIEGAFVDPPNGHFDPKHPSIYPGLEVETVKILTFDNLNTNEKKALCFGDTLYTSTGTQIAILRYTGRTSADVVQDNI